MTPPPPNRAAPLPPEERRAAIVAAAIPLVCDHGTAVTTREIAEAAGIAEGTIFRVFPDKDAVMKAVMCSVFDPAPFVAELRAIDPFDALERILTQVIDALRRRFDRVWQVMWMLRTTDPNHKPSSKPNTNEHDHSRFAPGTHPDMTEATNAVTALLEPHGDHLRVTPAEAARMLRPLVMSCVHPMITDGHPLPTAEIVDLLLHGISAPKTDGAPPVVPTDSSSAAFGATGQRAITESDPQPVGASSC